MSRRIFSQSIEFIKLRVVSPIKDRLGNTESAPVTPRARLAGFFSKTRNKTISQPQSTELQSAEPQSIEYIEPQPEHDPQSEFAREFYRNFQSDAQDAAAEANDEHQATAPSFDEHDHAPYRFSEQAHDESYEFYAEPNAEVEQDPGKEPEKQTSEPLLARLRSTARHAAETARAAMLATRETLISKARSPRETMMEFAGFMRVAAGQASARISQMRRMDAAVAGLFTLALLGPLVAPRLDDHSTIALTRNNPFVERAGVRAERGLALSPPSTPTLWSGVPYAVAERDIAPDWVLNAGVDLGPLSPAEALTQQARVIEVAPAPIWSPAFAGLGVEDDESSYEPIETASIPGAASIVSDPLNKREVAKLELGAFDTGPTAPVSVASGPTGVGDDSLAAGDYATASAGVRAPETPWPTIGAAHDGAELPSSVIDALSLGDGSKQTLPLASARIPSMRPVMVGAKRTPRLTVVLTAVGLNEKASRAALERLPSAVALAIAPVAKNPSAWVEAAHGTGRVTLLEIPMEPVTYPRVNPGPLTLLAGDDAEKNQARLLEALAQAPQVDGVASYLGSRFSSVRGAVEPVMNTLKEKNLFLLETDPGPLSQLLRTAAEIDMPAASSIVSLDKSGRAADLSEGFARLEEAARVKGHAIGVAVAVPNTIEALEAWTRDLEKRGFRLSALPL